MTSIYGKKHAARAIRALAFAGIVLTTLAPLRMEAAALLAPAPGSPFATGSRPRGIATGDFNGDGKADIAVANTNSNNVTVLLGNGAGGFTAAAGSPFAVGAGPIGIVVKDFNKDGKMDLAVVNDNDNTVTVLLGNGSGGFAASAGSPFAVGSLPTYVATGDFNGDTIPDLVISNSGSNNVSVLIGNGSGGFTASAGSPFATGSVPQGIVVSDFDKDGKMDIAVANQGDGHVTVLLGNGTGGFAAGFANIGANPGSLIVANLYGMTSGDFYNDGQTDLITASFGANEVNILRGNGSESLPYNAQFAVAGGPLNVLSADFDGDGNQDVAVVTQGGQLVLLLGKGNGTFNVATAPFFTTSGSTAFGLAIADFNGDGKPDVAVSNTGDNTVTVMLSPAPVVPPVGPPVVPPVVPPAVTQLPQSIVFLIANHLGSDQPFALQATASSGRPVTFSVLSGPATVNGNMLTLTGIGTVVVEAAQPGDYAYLPATADQSFTVALGTPTISSVVNGASFVAGTVPTNYYATIFGNNLAAAPAQGDGTSSRPLGGATITIVDSAKQTFNANLWLASYGQANFVVPTGLAAGPATVTLTNAAGKSASSQVTVGTVAPGLFSSDGSGTGFALAEVVIVGRDGSQTVQYAGVNTPFGGIPVPIPMASGSQVYLILGGTGIRGRSGLAGVSLTIGGTAIPVLFAGPQGSYPGLDQVDALLPASLAGAGTVKVQLTVDGVTSNILELKFQ